jgi:hypothetical protein
MMDRLERTPQWLLVTVLIIGYLIVSYYDPMSPGRRERAQELHRLRQDVDRLDREVGDQGTAIAQIGRAALHPPHRRPADPILPDPAAVRLEDLGITAP